MTFPLEMNKLIIERTNMNTINNNINSYIRKFIMSCSTWDRKLLKKTIKAKISSHLKQEILIV